MVHPHRLQLQAVFQFSNFSPVSRFGSLFLWFYGNSLILDFVTSLAFTGKFGNSAVREFGGFLKDVVDSFAGQLDIEHHMVSNLNIMFADGHTASNAPDLF